MSQQTQTIGSNEHLKSIEDRLESLFEYSRGNESRIKDLEHSRLVAGQAAVESPDVSANLAALAEGQAKLSERLSRLGA